MNQVAESVVEYAKFTCVVTQSNIKGIPDNVPVLGRENVWLK